MDQDFDNSFTVEVYSFHGNPYAARHLYGGRNNSWATMEDEKEVRKRLCCDVSSEDTLVQSYSLFSNHCLYLKEKGDQMISCVHYYCYYDVMMRIKGAKCKK